MMPARKGQRYCLHCATPFGCRIGRGLCRGCWNDVAIRVLYPPLAPFAGKKASDCSHRRYRIEQIKNELVELHRLESYLEKRL